MIAAFLLIAAQSSPAAVPDPQIARRVAHVLERSPVIDGHNDLAWEIRELHDAKVEAVDLSVDTARLPNPLQTDIPRLRKGHVGGQFWSVYIPADAPRAVEMTLEEIDIVRRRRSISSAASLPPTRRRSNWPLLPRISDGSRRPGGSPR